MTSQSLDIHYEQVYIQNLRASVALEPGDPGIMIQIAVFAPFQGLQFYLVSLGTMNGQTPDIYQVRVIPSISTSL